MLGSLPGGDFCSPKSDEKNDGRADGGGGGGGGGLRQYPKRPEERPDEPFACSWDCVSWGVL